MGKRVGSHYSIDFQNTVNVSTLGIYLVCCDNWHFSVSAEEHGGHPERQQEERDVPPEDWPNVRPIFTCTHANMINRDGLQQHNTQQTTVLISAALTNDHSRDENNLVGDGGARPQKAQASIGLPTGTEKQPTFIKRSHWTRSGRAEMVVMPQFTL